MSAPRDYDDLRRLAELIRERNPLDRQIAEIIGKPAFTGNVGKHILFRIFGIRPSGGGNNGRFLSGPLGGESVHVQTKTKWERQIDINPKKLPGYYLVLAGSQSAGIARPFVIEQVFLFEAGPLIAQLLSAGKKVGLATGVGAWCDDARIYSASALPLPQPPRLLLTPVQKDTLRRFAPTD